MKIAVTSNFDKEDYTEKFLEPLPITQDSAKLWSICHILNGIHSNGPDYYCVVDNDYQLQIREE